MTNNREEQIYEAADNATYQTPPQYSELVHKSRKVMSAYEVGFIDGCVWADEHPNWISVEDELPTIPKKLYCVEVLFRTKDSANHLGKYFGDDDKWISYENYTYKTEDISYWMKIQPPRKEETMSETKTPHIKDTCTAGIYGCDRWYAYGMPPL